MTKCLSKKVMFVLILGVLLYNLSEAMNISTSQGTGADTYLNYWSSSTNYGSDPNLKISKNYVPYLKFDLSSIGPNDIADADLVLYGTGLPVTGDFAVYGLLDGSDVWGESTINYLNAPVVTNPVTWHPLLIYLGRIYYTAGDPNAVGDPNAFTMAHTGGQPLNSFLNNRGPDGLVTIIIASGDSIPYSYFLTKEDPGNTGTAPFLSVSADAAVVAHNDWTGTVSNEWSAAGNWQNQSGDSSVPDSNSVVNLVSGTNYPVIIDSNSYAKKVFVHGGNLTVSSGTLTISDGVLRVKDGRQVDIIDGQIVLSGNVAGQMWGLIGKGKIITSKMCQQEVYAQYDPNQFQTIVETRDLVRKLKWGNSLVRADGPLGDPPGNGRAAQYCVDGSGMIGEAHIGFILGGTTVPTNSYYAYHLASENPTLSFEFDDVYALTDMYIWNYELSYAFQQVKIEHSLDNVNYTTLMNGGSPYFYLDYGNKDNTKNDIIPFGGVPARYVKVTAVGGAGIGNYEYGSSWGTYIMKEIQFTHDGAKACEPTPANNLSSVDIAVGVLKWIPGTSAVTGQDVWFGQTPGGMTKIGSNLAACADSIALSPLQSDKDYYWRVDARDAGGSPITGRLWHFRTKKWLSWNPGGEGVIFAFGIKTSGGSKGFLAANGSGMTGDLHSSWADTTGWNCKQPGLVGINEPQLFVEFDKIYNIGEMWVWNREGTTATDPLKTVQIEYSSDGVNYEILMNGSSPHFILPRGNTDGTHDTEITFGVPAKYVKFTAIGGIGTGNYGSTDYKLREVRFYPEGPYTSANAYAPVPAENSEVDIFVDLGWTPGTNAATGQDVWLGKTGESMIKIASNISPTVTTYALPELDNLSDYKWRVDSLEGESVTQGDEWHFSTRARLAWNPGLIGVANADGSPGIGGSQGYNAVNWSGLYYDYHYSSTDTSVPGYSWTTNAWYCRKPWELVPPVTEPQLKVTFDRIYDLDEIWVWNHDGMDTGTGDNEYHIAMKTIKIEYSTDDINYTTLMNGGSSTFILPHGRPDGVHDSEISFGNVGAKYVKITAVGGPGVGNYGSSLYGYKLREVRFYYQVPLWADMNYSKSVNLADFILIAADWLEENWVYDPVQYCQDKPAGDITGDCKVDNLDFAVLAKEWLLDIN
jgi:hypothetical protein